MNDGTGRAINMFQFKERHTPWDPTWVFGAKRSPTGPGDDLNLYDWHGGVAHNVPGGMPLPKGRWFQVVAYQKIGRTDGELTVFLDDVRILNLAGINTLGSVTNNNPPFVMWGVGNYGPAGIGKHIYVDDTSVANAATDSRSTSVQLSAPGTYLLRLTASNAQVTLSDTVQVIVR